MDYYTGHCSSNKNTLHIHIYDRELQLVYSGQCQADHQKQMKHKLSQCSLLFNIDNIGYFIKKA